MSNLLTPEEVAERLGVQVKTLNVWRWRQRRKIQCYDLPYVKMGRVIRYKEEDVQNFIESWGKIGGDHAARSPQ